MASNKPVIHGRDHMPGGADPLPASGSASSSPPFQPLDVLLSSVFSFDTGWSTVTIDTTKFGGGYRRTTADTSEIMLPFVAGPTGSIWATSIVYAAGTDYGRISVAYATASEDGEAGGVSTVGPGISQVPDDLTFVNALTNAVDAYSASPTSNVIAERTALFRIGGASAGAPLTAFTTDPVTGHLLGDGGPGPYWVRLTVTGHNASSSGYKFDLQAAYAERVPGG